MEADCGVFPVSLDLNGELFSDSSDPVGFFVVWTKGTYSSTLLRFLVFVVPPTVTISCVDAGRLPSL